MRCKLCESEQYIKRDGRVRDDTSLEIYECTECGLVYLSSLEHINNSFYENSGMHKEVDFLKWEKETQVDDLRRFEFVKNMITNKTVLDFGSGNGGFLKLAKQVAQNVSGAELEKGVNPYYEKEGITLYANVEEIEEKFDVITAYHVVEHLPNPQMILQTLSDLLVVDGKLIVEVPNANDALLSIYNSEAFSNFTYWSCHLYLYNQHTLSMLARKAGLKVEFTKHIQRYPLSNHLYWLSQGKPGGHVKWGEFLDSQALTAAYEAQLASLGATDTLIAIFSKDDL